MHRFLVSAAHKSSGKTTLSLGLAAALRQRGLAVQTFKKGPDYIDPLWLSVAAGRPCYNLDFFLSPDGELRDQFARHGHDAEVCLVEGNKGLYDGLDLEGSNSNAALARLLDHNQETVERQRTHVGNLAHALKTPLSVMLAEAGSQKGSLPDMVRKQTEVMKAQVDHHLRRARAAARAQMLGERTPIAEVLDEMAVMLERVFEEKAVEIDWRAPDELGFRGERQDLQEILGNLMENACKWAKRRVRVSAGPTGLGQMVVVVEDDGPGLPPDQREAALERGARMDETTPGSGLGLSIVVELTRAYGGKITLADSELGGLKVLLELPAAEA